MHSPSSTARPAAPHRERGIALFVVIVFVMLSMLLALWASRTAIFNEMVVGNDADYQRAFEAAQSLIQDAELDIRSTGDNNHRNGKSILPLETKEVSDILIKLSEEETRCKDGICVKRLGRQDFWNYPNKKNSNPDYEIDMNRMTAESVGATYGQFTKAKIKGNAGDPEHSILTNNGWYWIEILKYDENSGNSGLIVDETPGAKNLDRLDLRLNPSVVYRITAIAQGLKPNTQAVIQETYARTRLQD